MSEFFIYMVNCNDCSPCAEKIEEEFVCNSCKNYLCEQHYIESTKNKFKCYQLMIKFVN